MTICKQLEEIAEKMCNEYCKYPNQFNYDDPKSQEAFEAICEKCPISKLGI